MEAGNVLVPRKGMSEKGEECFPPYLRAWTQNGKMQYEEEKERCQSKQVGFIH